MRFLLPVGVAAALTAPACPTTADASSWVLIIALLGRTAAADALSGVSVSSVPGFSSQNLCAAAGEALRGKISGAPGFTQSVAVAYVCAQEK
jgi:hypothetical protein